MSHDRRRSHHRSSSGAAAASGDCASTERESRPRPRRRRRGGPANPPNGTMCAAARCYRLVEPNRRRAEMAIGPVQLIVLGFEHPKFHGEVIAELERLRESDTIRVIDALAVYKDAEGELEVEHLSNLTQNEAV